MSWSPTTLDVSEHTRGSPRTNGLLSFEWSSRASFRGVICAGGDRRRRRVRRLFTTRGGDYCTRPEFAPLEVRCSRYRLLDCFGFVVVIGSVLSPFSTLELWMLPLGWCCCWCWWWWWCWRWVRSTTPDEMTFSRGPNCCSRNKRSDGSFSQLNVPTRSRPGAKTAHAFLLLLI